MWCFDSDLNQMQSDVFNKKAEWLEAGGGGMKLAFCSDRETAVATLHIIELELSHELIRAANTNQPSIFSLHLL